MRQPSRPDRAGPGRGPPAPVRHVLDLLRHVPVPPAARRDLLHRMNAPGRLYHGMAHVALLWTRHRRLSRGTPFRAPRIERLIAAAIAYHDAVYVAARGDNEAASAALFRARAAAGGRMTRAERDWVAGTIAATADHLGAPAGRGRPLDRARLWMLDLDLTPLGERRAAFDRNTRLLRAEYAHLAEAEWEAGRLAFLARMAEQPRLYRTRRVADRFAARARANLARDLAAGGATVQPGASTTRSRGAGRPATARPARGSGGRRGA